jgi:hypothetical protein
MTEHDTAGRANDPQFAYATTPTARTLWLRTFIPWQVIRFAVINLRMLRLAWRGHHQ